MFAIERFRQLLAFLALAGLTSLSHAAFVAYGSQSAFIAGTFAAQIDTFDALPAGDLPASLSRVLGPYAYTVSSPSGLFGTGGADRWLSNFDRRESISFSGFGANVKAIGGSFFGTSDSGAAEANQLIMVTVTDTTAAQFSTLLAVNSASSFFGIASSAPILSVMFSVDPGNLLASYPTVNNFVVALVPEPGSCALLLVGLAAAGGAARRRAQRR